MREVLTRSGNLSAYPAEDVFAMAVPLTSVPSQESGVSEGLNDGSIRLAGRSALTQMGLSINILPEHEPQVVGRGDSTSILVPIGLRAHTDTAEAVIADLGVIRSKTHAGRRLILPNGENVEIGRLFNMDRLKRLDKDEVEYAFNSALISINTPGCKSTKEQYHINDDGSVTMPIGLVQTFINEFTLSTPEERFNVFEHGRAGLIPHTDTETRRAEDPIPDDFFIGGIPLSPGPFHCIIRENLDDVGLLRQLPEAANIDGNRLAGNGRHLDLYTGHRQIEVVNDGSNQNFGETTVTIDIYSDTKPSLTIHPAVDWWDKSMTIHKRQKLHERGINPLDIIKVSNPFVREQLLKTAENSGGGVVVSSHGVSHVPAGKTDRLTAQNITRVARSFGRGRSIAEDLSDLREYSEALAPAGDRSRIFIGPKILAEHMTEIVTSGDVRSFLVENFGDIAMRKQVHNALVNLVQSGVSFGWDNGGELREFHRNGLFVKPEFIDQMENLDFIWAMYGTHLAKVDAQMRPHIEDFFVLMQDLMPAEKMGVTHGNGPGVMQMADELARHYGILSMGVGIDVEDIGQGQAKLVADAVAFFKRTERLYRQEMMDKFRTLAVFNVGGYGTFEEIAVTLCTNKLGLALPSPSIIVDPDHLFGHAVQHVQNISSRTSFEAWGERIDISDKPLGQEWVSNTVHHVGTYQQAFDIIKSYWENPTGYWRDAKIPTHEIKRPRYIQASEYRRMGMRLATHLDDHARNYDL